MCFNTNLKIHPEFMPVLYRGEEKVKNRFAGAGLYVKDFHIYGVETTVMFEAVSTQIKLKFDSKLNITDKAQIKFYYTNLINGFSSDGDIETFISSSLLNDKKDASYWSDYSDELDLNIDHYDKYRISPGLKIWKVNDNLKNTTKVFNKNRIYYIEEDLVFEPNVDVIIEEGAKLYIASKKSILIKGSLSVNGTKQNPVIVTSKEIEKPFGALIISNGNGKKNIINNLKVSNGSQASLRHVDYLGALSVYGADLSISDSTFSDNKGTDSVNIVYSNVEIKDSAFINSLDDCLDLDFSEGILSNNYLANCGGDGIDFSYSNLTAKNNKISDVVDKGISVGEKSQVELLNNNISNSVIGIAVKDLSVAKILDNSISNSTYGLSSYIKKSEIGPPAVCGFNNTFDNVTTKHNFIDYKILKLNDVDKCNNF